MINPFLRSLEKELALVGLWGKSADQLKAEMLDHYQTGKDALQAEGKSEQEAEQLAISSLGSPRDLAARALAETRIGQSRFSQIVRRLGVFFFLPFSWFFMSIVSHMALLLVLMASAVTGNIGVVLNDFHYWLLGSVAIAGLVPLIVAMLWMGRAGFNPSRGWNQVLITSGYFALSYSVVMLIALIVQNQAHFPLPANTASAAMAATHALLPIGMILLMPWLIRAQKLKSISPTLTNPAAGSAIAAE